MQKKWYSKSLSMWKDRNVLSVIKWVFSEMSHVRFCVGDESSGLTRIVVCFSVWYFHFSLHGISVSPYSSSGIITPNSWNENHFFLNVTVISRKFTGYSDKCYRNTCKCATFLQIICWLLRYHFVFDKMTWYADMIQREFDKRS